jgi:hypothetical protein
MAATVTPPEWRTTKELHEQAIEANRALAEAMDPDDLLRLSARMLAEGLEHRLERGDV